MSYNKGCKNKGCSCSNPCNECEEKDTEVAIIKVKRFSAGGGLPSSCDDSNPAAPIQEPRFDIILESSTVPEVGSTTKINVENPSVYHPGQWIYISGRGKFKITKIGNTGGSCPYLEILNDCDGNLTPINGNSTAGTKIPSHAIFWPSSPPDCSGETFDVGVEVAAYLSALCEKATNWSPTQGVDAVIVCEEGAMVAKKVPSGIDTPVITKSGDKWVVKNLETLICDVLRSGNCDSSDDCTPSSTPNVFTSSGTIAITEGTTSIRIQAWGGGAGTNPTGGTGGAGGYTDATFQVGVAGLNIGSTIGAIVGGRGTDPGLAPSTGAGGSPGWGGDGANSGGGGGWPGGGGGSFVYVGTPPSSPNSKADVLVVAGGGGAGDAGNGTTIGKGGNDPSNVLNASTIEGSDHGGNTGGGGGGYLGGTPANGGSGYVSPLADAGSQIQYTTTVQGVVNSPPGSGDANYIAGKGSAGAAISDAAHGVEGLVVVTFITECD